jgi:hypothetical protein
MERKQNSTSEANTICGTARRATFSERSLRKSLEAFPSEKHFANWLGLSPTNDSSGGRVLKHRTPKVVNRTKTAFRQAASTHHRKPQLSYLGAQYRRLRTRLGAPKAITAMARKLACLFYRLLTKASHMSTVEPTTTNPITGNNRFARSSSGPDNLVCRFFPGKANHVAYRFLPRRANPHDRACPWFLVSDRRSLAKGNVSGDRNRFFRYLDKLVSSKAFAFN